MAKGGYRIINLLGRDISSQQIIPGAYEAVESSNGKPIMIQNFKISGIENPAIWINFKGTANTYRGVAMLGSSANTIVGLVINSEDKVYITALASSSPSGMPSEEDGPSASM